MAFKVDPDYKEVSERIDDLYERYPEGSLTGTYEVLELGAKTLIVYTALCYRSADDAHPAVGTAQEEFPGTTPYTKGSEFQNAETSAWGRAIVAAGASKSKRIASANEIRGAEARENAEGGVGREKSSHASATSERADSPSAIPKATREKLKSRCVDLGTGMGGAIQERRAKWNLPIVDECDERQIRLFGEMLDELEAELEKPFAEATK